MSLAFVSWIYVYSCVILVLLYKLFVGDKPPANRIVRPRENTSNTMAYDEPGEQLAMPLFNSNNADPFVYDGNPQTREIVQQVISKRALRDEDFQLLAEDTKKLALTAGKEPFFEEANFEALAREVEEKMTVLYDEAP